MVHAGEESSSLHEMLTSVSKYQKRQDEILTKVRTAMTYPILMALNNCKIANTVVANIFEISNALPVIGLFVNIICYVVTLKIDKNHSWD